MRQRNIAPLLAVFAALPIVPLLCHGEPGLELVATIPMPAVKGRIDHLAADPQGHRLYVAALGNDTLEVIDTARKRHERSGSGFGEPQGVAYVAAPGRLYVANGSAGRLDILDAQGLKSVRRIGSLDDADNVRHDAAAGSIIVGYGAGGLRVLDARSGEARGDIALAAHPESFQLEQHGARIFVNVPNARQVAVVDRSLGKVVATWPLSVRANFPMALDEDGRRL